MKLNLLLGLLLLKQMLIAQTFTEIVAPFDGVDHGTIAFADVDGDQDQDVLITGVNYASYRIAKLYTNDGKGKFTQKTGTPFDNVLNSFVAFADVDGDQDQDVLITGGITGGLVAQLYTNNGKGNFTKQTGTPFDGVMSGSIAFADVDGDQDQDVLITGYKSVSERIAKLYTNDGKGQFTEKSTPFDGVRYSSIDFADVDGDQDQDVLITGEIPGGQIAKLYTNDGMGNFTEKTGTPFKGVAFGSIAFADVDGDQDQDLLITGSAGVSQRIAQLCTNDGVGNFTEKTDIPFDGIYQSSIAFADVDGDQDQDVLFTGQKISNERIAKLYTNDGVGNFTEVKDTPILGVSSGSIAFADVNGDQYPDLLTTGISVNGRISKLYINDGKASSTDDLRSGFMLHFTPYPNPTKSNRLNISFNSTENGFTAVTVYDLSGHMISQQETFTVIGHQSISIEINSLSPGSYLLHLDHGKRRGVATFIVL